MKQFLSVFCTAALFAAPAFAEEIAPVALNSLTAAPRAITTAAVYDQNGALLGNVRQVVNDQDGHPAAVSYIARASGKLVVVAAPAVSYDGQRNILVADSGPQRLAAN